MNGLAGNHADSFPPNSIRLNFINSAVSGVALISWMQGRSKTIQKFSRRRIEFFHSSVCCCRYGQLVAFMPMNGNTHERDTANIRRSIDYKIFQLKFSFLWESFRICYSHIMIPCSRKVKARRTHGKFG